jgi:hypothetical protein
MVVVLLLEAKEIGNSKESKECCCQTGVSLGGSADSID